MKENNFMAREELREKAFVALGIRGTENFVFSNYRKTVIVLSGTDFSKASLINNFGKEFYSTFEDSTDAQDYIVSACIEKGIYDVEEQKGYGIFVDSLDKDELVINTSNIWGTSKTFDGSRVRGRTVYNNEKDLKVNKNQELPTVSEVKKFADILRQWNWSRGEQDVKMVLGWILTAPFAGALPWRTHASLTGNRGSGKSTFLEEVLSKTLGSFAILADGISSEAGIRQTLRNSASAVILDESEADSKKIASILTMFRTSSSGGNVLRGSASQTANSFTLKMAGFLAGIVPPEMNAADSSRFLTLELKPFKSGVKADKEIYKSEFFENIGRKLVAFMIKYYKDYVKLVDEVSDVMYDSGADGRYCATNSPLIASSFMILEMFKEERISDIFDNDVYLESFEKNKLKNFIKEFDFANEIAKNEKKDEEELLNFIFSSNIRSEMIKSDVVSNHILAAIDKYDYNESDSGYKVNKKEVKKLLGINGIALKEEKGNTYVYIDCTDVNFKKLLKDSKYEKGNIIAVLKRHKDYEEIGSVSHISINNSKRPKSKIVKIKFNLEDFNIEEELEKVIKKEEKEVYDSKVSTGEFVDFGNTEEVEGIYKSENVEDLVEGEFKDLVKKKQEDFKTNEDELTF